MLFRSISYHKNIDTVQINLFEKNAINVSPDNFRKWQVHFIKQNEFILIAAKMNVRYHT